MLCFLSQWGYSETEYFRSNSLGMLIDKIQPYRKDEYRFIMQRTWDNAIEIKVLLENGSANTRWETEYYPNQTVKTEKKFEANVLSNFIFYNPKRLPEEELNYTNGELSKKLTYQYDAGTILRFIKAYDKDGNLLYQDDYLFSKTGGIRQVKRTWDDHSYETTTFIQGGGKIAQEVHANTEQTIIFRYDFLNRLLLKEVWNIDNLNETQEYTYFADTNTVQQLKESNTISKFVYTKTYNEKGQLSSQLVEKNDIQTALIYYTWDDQGDKIEEKEKNANGLTLRKFTYDTEHNPATTEEYVRGSLELKTVYQGKDNLFKEYYNQKGEAVIRVYYEADVKVKEEILDKGQVVLTRVFP